MVNQLLFSLLLTVSPVANERFLLPAPDVGSVTFEFATQEQTPAKAPELTEGRKKKLVDRLAAEIERKYVFPEVGVSIAKQLKARSEKGNYSSIKHPLEFATQLTKDMQEIARDKHLNVFYYPAKQEDENENTAASDKSVSKVNEKPNEDEIEKRRNAAINHFRKLNYGVRRVEHFDGNVAYLDLFMIGDLAYVHKGLTAALTLLEGSDAMIIDLRDNTGGSPETVEFIVSHFVPQPTHIMDKYRRDDNSIRQSWTRSNLSVPVYDERKMVYILTSQKTFSAAEDFAYTMQALKRAKIVGETTGGGAHAGIRFHLDENFTAFIPNQRSISPLTKSNWEGVGVVPDLPVDANKALLVARIEILQTLLKKVLDPTQRSEIVESILALKFELKKM